MDTEWWHRLAHRWVKVKSASEVSATRKAMTSLVDEALHKRQKEVSLLDDILAGIDDDDD